MKTGKRTFFRFARLLVLASLPLGFTTSVSAQPLSKPPFSKSLTTQNLAAYIESQDIRSMQELLPLLPQELRDNFTLGFRSRSLQKKCVSPQQPRVILFSPDGHLVLAFTNDVKKPVCRNLEILEFNERDQRFEMTEIQFAGKASAPAKPVSRPESCVACHRSAEAPRPVWENYANWPGFYGGNDDVIGNLHLTTDDKFDIAAEENFIEYKRQWMSDPFYKHLGWKAEPEKHPYASTPKGPATYRPNLRLTKFLASYHAKNLARRARETSQYPKYKYAVQARYFQCAFTDGWVESSDEFLKKLAKADFRDGPLRILGIPDIEITLEFALDPKAKISAAYHDGFNFIHELVSTELFRGLVAEESALAPYFVIVPQGGYVFPKPYDVIDKLSGMIDTEKGKAACPQLKALHGKLYAKYARTTVKPKEKGSRNPFESCIACHVGEDRTAPAIAFDKPDTLKPAMLKKIRRRVRQKGKRGMPPGSPLEKDELEAIDRFKPASNR